MTLGFDDIGELDVVVPNALRDDPVRLAQWRRARHIDGQGTSSPAMVKPSLATQITAPPAASAMDPPTGANTSAVVVATGEEVTAAPVEDAALAKAS